MEFIGLTIIVVILFAYLTLKYYENSVDIDNLYHNACLLEAPPENLIHMKKVPLTKKEFLLGFLSKFQKCIPHDNTQIFSTRYMYQLYLQLHNDVKFPLKPYRYPNFCKEIRGKNLNFITVRKGNKTYLELRGYHYTDFVYKE